MKILLFIAVLMTFSNAEIVTNTVIKKAVGIGIATNRQSAVNEAIVEAVGKITGVNIQKNAVRKALSIKSSDGKSLNMQYSSEIEKVTRGKADSFKILNVSELNGQFKATVEVTNTKITKKYKTPGHSAHKRRKLVVVPSYSSDITFKVMNNHKTAKEVSQRLTQELVSAITQTRKFSVLDRENNSAYENEKNLILSRDAHKDELIKLGNILGTDYLVVSNLTDFRISNDQEYLSITGQTIDKLKAMATVQYRIIAMATKQIKWSNTTTFEFEPKGNSDEQFFAYSLKKISDDLTNEIIENIYPIKVANISRNGKVILSQGSKLGTIYDVFDLGEKLYDSYTKEFLGYDEVKTGTIKIVRALPKISYGQIIEGNVQKGNICRIQISTNSNDPVTDISEADKPSDVTQSDGGGVVLPF